MSINQCFHQIALLNFDMTIIKTRLKSRTTFYDSINSPFPLLKRRDELSKSDSVVETEYQYLPIGNRNLGASHQDLNRFQLFH